jgi:hypothetical protein
MVKIDKSKHLHISREIIDEVNKGFAFKKKSELSPAQGFHDLHDAVLEAFSSVSLGIEERNCANDLINCLQSLYETLAEQESIAPNSKGYFIEAEDLQNLVNNMGALGEAIRIHQTSMDHEVATALLWSKSALKKIVKAN